MSVNLEVNNKLESTSSNVEIPVKPIKWYGRAWKVISSPFILLIEKIIALFRAIVKGMKAFKTDFLQSFQYGDGDTESTYRKKFISNDKKFTSNDKKSKDSDKKSKKLSSQKPAFVLIKDKNSISEQRVSALTKDFDVNTEELKGQIKGFNFESLKIRPIPPNKDASLDEHVKFVGQAMDPLLKLANVNTSLRQTMALVTDLLLKKHPDSTRQRLDKMQTHLSKDLKSELITNIGAHLSEILATFELIKPIMETVAMPEENLTGWSTILFFLKDYLEDKEVANSSKPPEDLLQSIDESLIKVINILNASALEQARAKVETQISHITGIGNLGNSCYMNSVLQALFSSLHLSALIERKSPLKLKRTQTLATFALADAKEALKRLRDFYQKEAEEALGSELNDEAREFRETVFSSGATGLHGKREQQDAAELMNPLLDAIGCDFKYTIETSAKEGEIIEKSINTQDAHMLPLEFPKQKKSIKLDDIIKSAKLEEIDDKKNKWIPNGGEGFQRYQHAYSISEKIPEVLVVQMKRFEFDNYGGASKIKTPVTIDSENFDLSTFIDPKLLENGKSANYRLCSYVNHIGTSPSGGHYTANVRKGEQWFKCDDEDVITLSKGEEKKDREQAYLLVFERINPAQQS